MKTTYIDFLRKAFGQATTQHQHPQPFDHSRRDFIKNVSFLTIGGIASSFVNACQSPSPSKSKIPKKIAIIGAGIAGLSTAYYLQKQNIQTTIFEASSRVGGRMFSIKGWADKDITTDLGAEFVCEYHHELISLAQELNVALYDLRKDPLFNTPPSFFIEGKNRTFKDFVHALQPAINPINQHLTHLNFDFTYKQVPPLVQQLDQLSITQYLDQFPLQSWVKKLLAIIFEAEYGMDANEQSCLNMLCVLKMPQQNDEVFEMLGKDYEVLKIKGGTQALAHALYAQLKHQTFLNHNLIAYHKNPKQQYELVFNDRNNNNNIKTFDAIIFTIPFKILKKIPTNIVYPPHKQDAINNMGYANNCKTIFGFHKPAWRQSKQSGAFFTDLLAQCGWDSSAEQHLLNKNASSITFFYGGKKADLFNDLPNQEFLSASAIIINKNLNIDFQKHYNNKTTAMLWKDYPFAQCSYTAFKVGQWTKFTGVPQEPFQNIYFAGEHCDTTFQGFMNGAIRSAQKLTQMLTQQLS